MCEYCGCQDIPAIAQLTDEHDEIRSVARDAVSASRSGDHCAATRATRRLLDMLAPHTEIEERGLFPAMAGEFVEHTATLIGEHRSLEAELGELASSPSPADGWARRLDAAVGDLFNHILREQDGLFPASLSVLTSAQWDHLDDIRAEVVGSPSQSNRFTLPSTRPA